jgi:hypothetical protein
MLDESKVNALYAKFRTSVAPDIDRKFEPFIADELRNIAAEVQARGIDFVGFIESDEDGFLEQLGDRVRGRLEDIGVSSSRLRGVLKDVHDWQVKAGIAHGGTAE